MELLNILEGSLIRMVSPILRFKVQSRVLGPPRDHKKCLKWYKFENQNDRREQMMHQNIRFNFLFNLEDDGKETPKLRSH